MLEIEKIKYRYLRIDKCFVKHLEDNLTKNLILN